MAVTEASKRSSYLLGLRAEFVAAWLLRFKGYRILSRRYRTSAGEVDLIARKRNTLVFVEVKARNSITEAVTSLTPKMKRRVMRAAEFYISQNPQLSDLEMRFDLVAFAPFFQIRHLDNAWQVLP